MKESGIVEIHGREYQTVALRVKQFRESNPLFSIKTKILSQAELITVKAIVLDDAGRVLATGHAEEDRSRGNINKTSALENCETSAVGRALAFLGYGGTDIASADDISAADMLDDLILDKIAACKSVAEITKIYKHLPANEKSRYVAACKAAKDKLK